MEAASRPLTEADVIAWLVGQVPELGPLLDEHVSFNGELLPYVVFESDFLRWFIERVRMARACQRVGSCLQSSS